MIVIHMILDINVFHINYQHKDAHWALMYKTLYTETTYQSTGMKQLKGWLLIHSVFFSNYI